MTEEDIIKLGDLPHVEDNYKGVDIYNDKGRFCAYIYSYERGRDLDICSYSIDVVKSDLDGILSYNYYNTLKTISDHFGVSEDFNRPEDYLEKLRDRIVDIINDRI